MDHVSFADSTGVNWSVREDGADETRAVTHANAPTGTSWLRFESEYEVRRLWHYPDDWRGLNALQLESLLDRASTVIARFRPVPHRHPSSDGQVPSATGRPDLDARSSRSHPRPSAPRPRSNERSDNPDEP